MSLSEENQEKLEKLEQLEKKYDVKEKEDLKQNLSVAERLMRRTETTYFETTFEDDLGDITIKTRLMTSSERMKALKLNQLLGQGAEDMTKYEEAITGLKDIAAEICVTPGLDEYLRSDKASDDVIVALIMRSLYGTIEAVGTSVTSFRKK